MISGVIAYTLGLLHCRAADMSRYALQEHVSSHQLLCCAMLHGHLACSRVVCTTPAWVCAANRASALTTHCLNGHCSRQCPEISISAQCYKRQHHDNLAKVALGHGARQQTHDQAHGMLMLNKCPTCDRIFDALASCRGHKETTCMRVACHLRCA